MAWIKRNLVLVISGVLALGLLGFGGYYLWSAIQKNNSIDAEIGSAKSEIERLLAREPTPNASNLNIARRELARLTGFNAVAKRQFPPTPGIAEFAWDHLHRHDTLGVHATETLDTFVRHADPAEAVRTAESEMDAKVTSNLETAQQNELGMQL